MHLVFQLDLMLMVDQEVVVEVLLKEKSQEQEILLQQVQLKVQLGVLVLMLLVEMKLVVAVGVQEQQVLLELEVGQVEMVEMVLMFHPVLQVVMEQRGLWVQQDIFQEVLEVVDLLQ